MNNFGKQVQINSNRISHLKILILLILVSSFSLQNIASAKAKDFGKDTIIFQKEGLRLHRSQVFSKKQFCSADPRTTYHEINVVYDLPHLQRLKRMGSSYKSFVKDTVIPAIVKTCGNQVNAKNLNLILIMHKMDQIVAHQDAMYFISRKNGITYTKYQPGDSRTNLTQQQITALTPAYILKHKKAMAVAYRKKNSWRYTKCQGAFCDLPGGLYLNAIYNNNIKLIKQIDNEISIRNLNSLKQESNRVLGPRGSEMLKKAMAHMKKMNKGRSNTTVQDKIQKGLKNLSMLRYVADFYMYHPRGYNPFSMACKEKLVTRVKTHKSATYSIETAGGLYMGQGGGQITKTVYTVKPNFVKLCNRVCSPMGGDRNLSVKRLRQSSRVPDKILKGVIRLRSDVKYCKNSKLKRNIAQFERNLIALTNRYLNTRTSWSTP